jgi:hypothetical protein
MFYTEVELGFNATFYLYVFTRSSWMVSLFRVLASRQYEDRDVKYILDFIPPGNTQLRL